ncbi:protein da1-related 2 [Phtheirospermum japonicum]|uniref:Protein da1-related 2 n=1 Tax=Phtheirospermum japonicum TaxID=374723 RepID=A0A830DMP5_9LAMI|nr:protein da1-related 2 [Phtheirospermum japonicum]
MSSSDVNHLSQPCIYERKSRFMKWVSRLFKGGPGNNRRVTTGGPQPAQSFGDENTVWRAPVRSLDDRSRANKEKEELDRAIALSMAEDLKKPNGYKWRTDNEEDLARTVNDGFNSAPYPPYAPNDYYHRDYRMLSLAARVRYPITEHGGRDTYHKSCFKEADLIPNVKFVINLFLLMEWA